MLLVFAFTNFVAQAQTEILFDGGEVETVSAAASDCSVTSIPFYDAAGSAAPYSDKGTGTMESFTVTGPGVMTSSLGVKFDLLVLNGDVLDVFDGVDDTAPSLGSYTGTVVPLGGTAVELASTSGSLTFRLTYDDLSNAEGWEGSIAVSQFTPSVTVSAAGSIAIADCNATIPAVPVATTYDCGTPGNPAYTQVVKLNGVAVPFLDGVSDVDGDGDSDDDDIVPATGTGIAAGAAISLPAGSALMVGDNEVCVDVIYTDPAGAMTVKATDCADISVNTPPLACNNNLNIGLDGDCSVVITPDLLLEGCDNGVYEITLTLIQADADLMFPVIVPVGNGTDAVTVGTPGRYRYSIRSGDNSCWGFLNLEDKQGPVCAPAGDRELRVVYDRDCDGDLTNGNGSAQLTT
ncbi:MAG: hypothetical protein AB8G86_13910, partial [Saprospiraceae bacterium]